MKRRSRKTYIEGPIQSLYPPELRCDTWKRQKAVHQCSKQPLNVNGRKFKPQKNAVADEFTNESAKEFKTELKRTKMNSVVVYLTNFVE